MLWGKFNHKSLMNFAIVLKDSKMIILECLFKFLKILQKNNLGSVYIQNSLGNQTYPNNFNK